MTGLNVYSGLTADRLGATFANIVTSLTASNINGTNGRIGSLTASNNLSVPNTALIGSLTATNVSVTTKITVPTPVSSNDAATKDYVDTFNGYLGGNQNYGGIDASPSSSPNPTLPVGNRTITAVSGLIQGRSYFVSLSLRVSATNSTDRINIFVGGGGVSASPAIAGWTLGSQYITLSGIVTIGEAGDIKVTSNTTSGNNYTLSDSYFTAIKVSVT